MKSANKKPRPNWRPFEEARAFVRSLHLKNHDEWRKWAKSTERPEGIPSYPNEVYKNNGWVGVGDWLGTENIATHNRVYRPFNEAREYVRNLNFVDSKAWKTWAKSEKRPSDIPVNPPRAYKNKGWINWSDWLGTRRRNGKWRSFEEAQKLVHSLNLQTRQEWNLWSRSNSCPLDIPRYPQDIYKNKGWIDWNVWLGTGRKKIVYFSFEEARQFSHSLKLLSQNEWRRWAKSGHRPENIPIYPEDVYKNKGWVGWHDWLGTQNKRGGWRTFEEARAFANSLGLIDNNAWRVWVKSSERPDDIPLSPQMVYKNKGWAGWGDWLGTNHLAPKDRIFLSYQEAREYVRNLHLKNSNEWRTWAKSAARPIYIPANPARTYESNGWKGIDDWLGSINLWNSNSILNFLNGIKPVLNTLQPSELYAIMRQNGMLSSIKPSYQNANAPLIKSIRDLCSSPNPEADFETLIAEIERENQLADELDTEAPDTGTLDTEPLPALRSLGALKAVDELVQAGVTSDEETIEFLISNRVSGLWQDVLNQGGVFNSEELRYETGGVYFETIRNRFLSQYDGAQSLAIPRGYDFRVKGELTAPNLMQKLAAYRVLTEKRLGNWSGVGAGKTLSAILASRVIDARLTVIVAFNSTVNPWALRIKEAFPDSVVHVKERGHISVDTSKHTYLVLNFETFQQPDSAAMVERLVKYHEINFVVLDEIQSVKQRTPKLASKRRQVVSGLLTAASEKNPDLCVLGMSATPVINNLYEAKALLELVKGVTFDELETFSNIPNAIAMHEKLILYGIRYRPAYNQTIETDVQEIQGNDFLPRLVKLRKGAILDLEKALLDAKIPAILFWDNKDSSQVAEKGT